MEVHFSPIFIHTAQVNNLFRFTFLISIQTYSNYHEINTLVAKVKTKVSRA